MKSTTIKKLILAAVAVCSTTAFAQENASGYFLDHFFYRYKMNPAIGNSSSFLSVPFLGNTNVSLYSSLKGSDLFYNVNGTPVSWINPNVPDAQVRSRLSGLSKAGLNANITMISTGFYLLGGYVNFDYSAKYKIGATVPGEMFMFMRDGLSNREVCIRDMRGRIQALGVGSINYSHDVPILEGLRVGATVKFLSGVASTDFHMREFRANLGEDDWVLRTDASVMNSGEVFKLRTSTNPDNGKEVVTGFSTNNYIEGKEAGRGYAFDLGAEYKTDNWTFSASVTDIGSIRWDRTEYAHTDKNNEFKLSDYEFSATGSNDSEMDRLNSNLNKLFQMNYEGYMEEIREERLGATLNVGVDYALPNYSKLHFSLLGSACFDGDYSHKEMRLGVNYAPANFFAVNANVGVGTYGLMCGYLLNFNTPFLSLFFGQDLLTGGMVGLNFPF